MAVKVFAYTSGELAKLETPLSVDRLRSYGTRATRETLELYVWNTALAAAFYGPLQGLEIALRNALHGELTSICGRADWYKSRRFRLAAFDLTASIAGVANRLTRDRKRIDPPHVVAGLHFGF